MSVLDVHIITSISYRKFPFYWIKKNFKLLLRAEFKVIKKGNKMRQECTWTKKNTIYRVELYRAGYFWIC